MRYFYAALALVLLVTFGSSTAKAQSVMFEYYATLSPRDTYSSQGVPFDDVCAIVQQDRANVHRFGNPDGDEPDSFFTTPERRAMIAGKCDYDRTHHTAERIRSQNIGFVLVRVYGSGGQIARVRIFEAAG
ncbi:hypothetical protein ATO8_09211 [Roseivivax marinus]|uniref:Uncharacterized protein n=1 Tax=Roseivivax marinus TaxID=1379903 RepID=W4HN39_9RHOB|nr:hypothetical protein [Roseivivax marinus]ETW13380.1 hypothetical protein ATO8_09211 [Roseivivax marinus]